MRPDVQARFTELTAGPDEELRTRVDEAALLLAAAGQGRDRAWVAAQLARLDEIAAGCPPGLDGLVDHLFGMDEGALGLTGDVETYGDPQNSYVDRVLDRRLGIPITLSLVAIVIGQRTGVPLAGIGMPGHFLVRHEGHPRVLLDCFQGGKRLTSGDCQKILEGIAGGPLPDFDLTWLEPTAARDIVVRMLTNLRQRALAMADVALLGWVAPLRASMPGMGDDDLRLLTQLRAKLS